MRTISSAVLVLVALALCGCVTNQLAEAGFHAPTGHYRLIVMQPDIAAGEMTAGGVFEQRDDWTTQGRDNVLKALETHEAAHGAEAKIATTAVDTGFDPAAVQDLIELHRAVGAAIEVHQYGNMRLPTKKGRFDWTLGEPAVAFGVATHYDYALFLHVRDSFASAGRKAVVAVGMLGCVATALAFGACAVPSGGQQVAYASLVDLKTGNVAWFNWQVAGSGDIRTPDGAGTLVEKLLQGMTPAGSTTKPRGT